MRKYVFWSMVMLTGFLMIFFIKNYDALVLDFNVKLEEWRTLYPDDFEAVMLYESIIGRFAPNILYTFIQGGSNFVGFISSFLLNFFSIEASNLTVLYELLSYSSSTFGFQIIFIIIYYNMLLGLLWLLIWPILWLVSGANRRGGARL